MPSIRKVKTASGATAVQVVAYRQRKVVVVKHIGSAHSEEEISSLMEYATSYVHSHSNQLSMFPFASNALLSVKHLQYLGVTHRFARDFLLSCAQECGLQWLSALILDLALMRIIEPASKLRTLELIGRYFGIHYSQRVYRTLPTILETKNNIERAALTVVKNILAEEMYLVLYDVTTLYFETHNEDELRIPGYSKDDKSKQPQIVVGLLVTQSGFPLAHEVFAGNTFEGKTMLPMLERFSKTHNISLPTVVADSAMLSEKTLVELKQRNMFYIVGARLANAPRELIESISTSLNRKQGATMRIASLHGDLICSFSEERYKKDKREMDKQLEKAKELVAKNEAGKRAKFVRKTERHAVELNKELITKTTRLLGIKGYTTNIPDSILSNADLITRYHDLWHVEHAFRMSKHDLATRPIFHHKHDAIKAHVLVCFVALMLGKYLETVTGISIRKIRDLLWSVTDASLHDKISGKTHILRSSLDEVISSPLGSLIRKWNLSY